MKKIFLVSAIILLTATSTMAQTPAAPAPEPNVPAQAALPAPAMPIITVDGAYAFATNEGQNAGAAFLSIHNTGAGADRMIGLSQGVADTAEIHTTLKEDNNMVMVKRESIDIPPNSDTSFDPLGHHIMLMNLRAPLKVGDSFPLILRFQTAGDIQVNTQIRAAGDVPSAELAPSEPEAKKP